jgi:arylformamidase
MTDSATAIGWEQLGPADREREYSPSSCVDDVSPFIEAYATRSAGAYETFHSAGLRVVELRYGSAESQTVDLVTPPVSDSPVPLVVFIHGGYWQELSKVDSFFAAADCVGNDIAFAALDYTLAPQASLEEIVGECVTAVGLLVSVASEHNIDSDRIVVTGSSAGAHLAAMVAVGSAGWRPAAVVLISGVFELEPLVGTYVNDALGLSVDAARRNSPLLAELDGFPETLITHGDNETAQFKLQSQAMAAALRDAGVKVTELEIPSRNHFDVVLDLCDENTELGRHLTDLVWRSGQEKPAR